MEFLHDENDYPVIVVKAIEELKQKNIKIGMDIVLGELKKTYGDALNYKKMAEIIREILI